jgi:hypothetical protein
MAFPKISALVIGACLISTGANAQATRAATFGAWRAWQDTDNAGYPFCAITNYGTDRSVTLMTIHPDPHLIIMIEKNSWALPANSKAPLAIRIGNQTFHGIASVNTKSSLKLKIANDTLANFLNHFEIASKMYITFESGDEHPWYALLNGADDAILWMKDCLRHNNQPAAATQPTEPVAPTQPVSTP